MPTNISMTCGDCLRAGLSAGPALVLPSGLIAWTSAVLGPSEASVETPAPSHAGPAVSLDSSGWQRQMRKTGLRAKAGAGLAVMLGTVREPRSWGLGVGAGRAWGHERLKSSILKTVGTVPAHSGCALMAASVKCAQRHHR